MTQPDQSNFEAREFPSESDGRRSTWVNELGREVEGECPDCDGTGRLGA